VLGETREVIWMVLLSVAAAVCERVVTIAMHREWVLLVTRMI
jgi:hypothetical protein